MDIQEIRNLVFAKTNMRISEDDPLLVLVALNEAILEQLIAESVTPVSQNLESLNGEFLAEIGNKTNELRKESIEIAKAVQILMQQTQGHVKAYQASAQTAIDEYARVAAEKYQQQLGDFAVRQANTVLNHEVSQQVQIYRERVAEVLAKATTQVNDLTGKVDLSVTRMEAARANLETTFAGLVAERKRERRQTLAMLTLAVFVGCILFFGAAKAMGWVIPSFQVMQKLEQIDAKDKK